MTDAERYRALREYRKAVRDALYAKHGDEWRKYEPNPGSFWDVTANTDDERQFLQMIESGKLNA